MVAAGLAVLENVEGSAPQLLPVTGRSQLLSRRLALEHMQAEELDYARLGSGSGVGRRRHGEEPLPLSLVKRKHHVLGPVVVSLEGF